MLQIHRQPAVHMVPMRSTYGSLIQTAKLVWCWAQSEASNFMLSRVLWLLNKG